MATVDLCPSGHQLSQAQGISGYDASYLALARRHGATPLTAD
jgi:predicted nucleic acid-binding protein